MSTVSNHNSNHKKMTRAIIPQPAEAAGAKAYLQQVRLTDPVPSVRIGLQDLPVADVRYASCSAGVEQGVGRYRRDGRFVDFPVRKESSGGDVGGLLGILGLEEGRFRHHGDGFQIGAHLQSDVDALGLRRLYRDAGLVVLLEPRRLDGQLIVAGR